MNVTNIYLSRHEDVKDLAERIGKDIGSLDLLTTDERGNIVAAINELKGILSGVEIDLGDYATKDELTQAIIDLINGADVDADTLKELADKITALGQADNGLVSVSEPQDFNESQKQQARDNVGAAAKSDIPDISGLATKAESDTNYHKKAVTYTRTEMDSRYYTKTQSDANYHNKTVTYTRTEMDARYPLKAASYTKAESDGRYAKVWTGTLTQYNAITTKDGNTIYIVT